MPQDEGAAGGPARVASVVTLALALAGSLTAALLPVYSGSSESLTTDPATGETVTSSTESSATLAQKNGFGVLLLLAVPVVVAALPLVARRSGTLRVLLVTTAVALAAVTVLGALSVGTFFAPAAVAAVVAAALPARRRQDVTTGV